MTESQFKGIAVFPSKEAYENLSPKPDGVFCVYPDSPVVKTGRLSPRSSTVADFVGQFYLNTTYGTLFQCIEISNGTYNWKEIGEQITPESTPIYSHRVTANNGEEELIIQFYSTIEFFNDLSQFYDFLNEQPPITGFWKSSSGNYSPIYSVEKGSNGDDLVFYHFGVGETLFGMLQNIIEFNDHVVEI